MATVPSTTSERESTLVTPDLRAWLQIGLITSLIAGLYYGVLGGLVKDWWTEPAWSQGLILCPLALYMAWLGRHHTLAIVPVTDNRGLWFVAAACLFYLLGNLGAEFFIARMSFVILLIALVWTFWRTLTFPFLLLATMIPLPVIAYNAMAAPLQLFASAAATDLAQAAGISVYRDGNIINLAHASLGVEEACSGLNSLSALVVGSLILGFLFCVRVRTRLAVFFLSIPIAIALNVVRITGTAIIADYQAEFALGFYHMFTGWLVFLVGFGLLYGAAALLHRLFD
jgi:exosortase